MRRLELVKAVDTVASAVSESHVAEFLEMIAKRTADEKDTEARMAVGPMGMEAMSMFRRYAIAAHAYGPIEQRVAEMFALQHLAQDDFWATLLFGGGLRASDFRRLIDGAIRGAKSLTLLQQILAPEPIEMPPRSAKDPGGGIERLSIVVVEDKGRLSRPERLVNVLQGISALYETHAFLFSLPSDTLLVAACDSGSDKAFDFLGVAKAIQALKETILSLWDRVVFFRERKMLVNVHLVAEALPVLSEISALAERKAIGSEQAEILRRRVIESAGQLVEAGAITPELMAPSHRDVRALVAPEPKLLGPPKGPAAPESPSPNETGKKTRKTKR